MNENILAILDLAPSSLVKNAFNEWAAQGSEAHCYATEPPPTSDENDLDNDPNVLLTSKSP